MLKASLAAMAATAGGTLLGCGSRETESASTDVTETPYPIAAASWRTDADRATSVQRVVELLGGMPWIRPGDHVLLKPSINSPNIPPSTSTTPSSSKTRHNPPITEALPLVEICP